MDGISRRAQYFEVSRQAPAQRQDAGRRHGGHVFRAHQGRQPAPDDRRVGLCLRRCKPCVQRRLLLVIGDEDVRFELIEELKADEALRRIPIMAVTAYAGREDEDRIRAAGADAYVSKPISLARFVQEVAALLPETVN